MPIIRSAHYVARTDLMRSASFANKKAKQMMGNANPLVGADIRKPASTSCPSCHRWHRPGVVCPNTRKSVPTEALFRSHGEHVVVHNGNGGNPYRNPNGAWSGTPGEDVPVTTPNMAAMKELAPPPAQQEAAPPVQPEAMQQEAALPAAMMAAPIPKPTPQPISPTNSLLNYQPPEPVSPSPQQQQLQLTEESAHLQGQNLDYLNALRNWQARYSQ